MCSAAHRRAYKWHPRVVSIPSALNCFVFSNAPALQTKASSFPSFKLNSSASRRTSAFSLEGAVASAAKRTSAYRQQGAVSLSLDNAPFIFLLFFFSRCFRAQSDTVDGVRDRVVTLTQHLNTRHGVCTLRGVCAHRRRSGGTHVSVSVIRCFAGHTDMSRMLAV